MPTKTVYAYRDEGGVGFAKIESRIPMPNYRPSRVDLSGNSEQGPDVAHAQKHFFLGAVDVCSKAVCPLQRDVTAPLLAHKACVSGALPGIGVQPQMQLIFHTMPQFCQYMAVQVALK